MNREIKKTIRRNNDGLDTKDPHYSEKGGHQLRGAFVRHQSLMESVFGSSIRYIPDDGSLSWARRRYQRKEHQSGRR